MLLSSKNTMSDVENKDIFQKAQEIQEDLLPSKSRKLYEKEYKKFSDWCLKQNVNTSNVSDEVLLVYLHELSKCAKPSTLWSKFSMIKSTLAIKENVDIRKFCKCNAFLKRQNVGFMPKKSNVLTGEQITKFMLEAPNELWLLSKVILLLGIFGACRTDDLINLTIGDIQDHGHYFTVFLKDGKTHRRRSFIISNDSCSFKPCDVLRKYIALRPQNMNVNRLLIGYRAGKCVAQNVGKHTISSVPRLVAQYLNIKDPESYTGHALRRSSATMLVEGGGDLLTLKRHGGWQSSSVAEGYIEDSLVTKSQVSRKLFNNIEKSSKPHTVTSSQLNLNERTEDNEILDYFGADDIFENDETEHLSNSTIPRGNINIQNTQSQNIVNHAGAYGKTALQRGIYISNNENCTINITYK